MLYWATFRTCAGCYLDQEWLDALNQERKKEQIGPVSYETFEIVMDQLEKEWFNLVSPPTTPSSSSHFSRCNFASFAWRSRRRSPNRTWPYPLKIRLVRSATTQREKTRMRLCFVMGVIWRCIKVSIQRSPHILLCSSARC